MGLLNFVLTPKTSVVPVLMLALLPLGAGCSSQHETAVELPPKGEPALPSTKALEGPWADLPEPYVHHVKKLQKERLPKAFTVVYEPPFIVVGDEDPATVNARAGGTVRWATQMLKQDYFKKDPEAIIDIWLFRDATSYQHHTQKLWGHEPGTPYGYYSESNNALIMNIRTGGGTLVHEMVHPFMHANFPKCPSWFNEGLASLYEQCGEKDGHIYGYTNWRLPGLQEAIRAGELPWFKDLMATSEDEFYHEDPGTHYSQSRYLCYFLQEKGLLVHFYHAFVANQKEDPTGYMTLKRVLGNPDMEEFQRMWETWVLGLKYG